MSFTGSFSIVQNISSITVTDTSTGSDGSITDRRITITLSDGSTLVPPGTTTSYIDFPLSAGASITINNLLLRDYAPNVTVDWITASPVPGNVYTSTQSAIFDYYTSYFLYGLTQERQVANPNIIRRNNYSSNKTLLWSLLLEAENCISLVGDITNAQACLNEAYNMTSNPQRYF